MSFPVWRELKLTRLKERLCSDQQAYNVLSRLKGIETLTPVTLPITSFSLTYNVLSRLKGIETLLTRGQDRGQYPYNVLSRLKGIETLVESNSESQLRYLQCPFPFEGNWNPTFMNGWLWVSRTYNVLSRLKGIETQLWFPFHLCLRFLLTMSFPVWRELKHFCSAIRSCSLSSPYNVLSRLKGIETSSSSSCCLSWGFILQCPFPFEGNWNKNFLTEWTKITLTYNVLSRLKGIETAIGSATSGDPLSYNVLSRLKGIETLTLGDFWCFLGLRLTMSFPVWRELKHQ